MPLDARAEVSRIDRSEVGSFIRSPWATLVLMDRNLVRYNYYNITRGSLHLEAHRQGVPPEAGELARVRR
jgi:hypothetical protein